MPPKKKAILTSDLLKSTPTAAVSEGIPQRGEEERAGESTAPAPTPEAQNENNPIVGLNVSVPKSFRKEFKTWCIANDMTMVEAIIKGFELLKKS
jgi:hypothetical protein